MAVPSQLPPSYVEATGSSSAHPTASHSHHAHLEVPGASSSHAIPADHRRSMEDELRDLPSGWVRTFDPETAHQFFVDTKTDPPRSIWHHPYDDEQYLGTLSAKERERVEEESLGRGYPPTKADIMAAHTDDEDEHEHEHEHYTTEKASSSVPHDAELPPRPDHDKAKKLSFTRKMKNKMTGTTHEEREQERKQRAEKERKAYERYLYVRQVTAKAQQTGTPQSIGKDAQGKDIMIEPQAKGFVDGDYVWGYGYNPFTGPRGLYSPPNTRYVKPSGQYSRPYGGGFGYGYGTPLAVGGGVGLMGGLMMGSMLGDGFGMGGGVI